MKKTTAKRITTAILAVSTIASSALLFAGCGEKSAEEKAVDTLNSLANDYNSKLSKAKESSKEVEKVTPGFFKTMDASKAYTIKKYNNEDKESFFYAEVNSPIEADGFTFTKTEPEKFDKGLNQFSSSWEIAKDGEKKATFILCEYISRVDENYQTNVTMFTANGVNDEPGSEYSISLDYFDNYGNTEFKADVPKPLTSEDCAQHLSEINAFTENLPITDGKASVHSDWTGDTIFSDLKAEGVYYAPANGDDYPYIVYVYTGKSSTDSGDDVKDVYVGFVYYYPFIQDGKLDTIATLGDDDIIHGSDLNDMAGSSRDASAWVKIA